MTRRSRVSVCSFVGDESCCWEGWTSCSRGEPAWPPGKVLIDTSSLPPTYRTTTFTHTHTHTHPHWTNYSTSSGHYISQINFGVRTSYCIPLIKNLAVVHLMKTLLYLISFLKKSDQGQPEALKRTLIISFIISSQWREVEEEQFWFPLNCLNWYHIWTKSNGSQKDSINYCSLSKRGKYLLLFYQWFIILPEWYGIFGANTQGWEVTLEM